MKRREFLIQAGSLTAFAAGGGLTIVNASVGQPVQLTSPDSVLKIDDQGGVIFTSPYTEMGQGAMTAAAMIMADELDTDLDRMEIRNHDGRVVLDDPTFDARFNGGGSGGSQSMATAWPAIREIGATARTALIEAAALTWSVPAGECTTSGDCVVHPASGRKLGYWELVDPAAARPLPAEAVYRDVSDYRYVGRKRPRADMGDILSGQASYAMDQQVPGMVYASIERCPTVSGSPAEYDKESALAVDGVIDVFSINPKSVEERAKCSIVVVARDTWSALQGRRKLRAQWEDSESAYSDEPAFWAAMQQQLEHGHPNAEHTEGEFEAVATEGLEEMTREYRLGHQNQSPMEPIAMTAHHRGEAFELWTGTQYPSDYRQRIEEITGIPQDQIVLHNTIMGGSFGRKYVRDGLTEVVMIADRIRKPVKLVWTREDDIRNGQYRNASLMRIQAHLDKNHELKRWYMKAVQTHPREPEKVSYLSDGMTDSPYRLPPARFEITGSKGNVNLGPMRSPPHPAKIFPLNCFIDELAHESGVDPIDLHIRLIGEPRELPQGEWLTGHGHVDNTGVNIELARAVRRLSGWDDPLPDGHGKGFAVGYFFGTHIATVVEVAWRDEMISIEKAWCAVNCGRVINPDIARQQVEGGTIYGLSSAMGEVITTAGGAVQQGNFNDYPLMRFAQAPDITVEFVDSDERPSGLGEPATPPAYPALANAIFAASGRRIREIPLNRHINFAPTRRFS